MHHPNVKYSPSPFVIAIGEHGVDGPGAVECDEATLDALEIPCRSIVTSSLVMIPGEPVHLALTDPHDLAEDLLAALAAAGERPVVKLGPVYDEGQLRAIEMVLRSSPAIVVLDGEPFASMGEMHLPLAAGEFFQERLIPRAALFALDVDEAEQILGHPLNTHNDLDWAANELLKTGPKAVLLKGGQLGGGDVAADRYVSATGSFWICTHKLSPSLVSDKKGLFANMASAIAAGLALGLEMNDALIMARGFMQRVYREAEEQPAPFPCSPADLPWVITGGHRLVSPLPAIFPPLEGKFPRFYPIVETFDWVRRLVEAGVTTLQLRNKTLDGEALEEEVVRTIAYCRERNVQLFVNDYWRLAIKHKAYGVHLGQEDLQTADITAIRAAGLRLGLSTHCYFEAAVAHGIRPSYIALGPVYQTKIKSMKFAPQGLETLRLWRAMFDYPVVAIGGITLEKADEVLEAGADLVSVITDVVKHDDPESRIKAWLAKF